MQSYKKISKTASLFGVFFLNMNFNASRRDNRLQRYGICQTKQNVIEEKEEKEVLVYDISYI
jgi:hypothetical protein